MTKPGKLYLIPNVIADGTDKDVIPRQVLECVKALGYFLAEDVRTARRYISSLNVVENLETLKFAVLNKDTREDEVAELMRPLLEGISMGVITEAGCPGVADPGAMAVYFAHRNNIDVVPLVGPSSILLALMASGFNGQRFAFHGYLPIDEKESAKSIKELERESKAKNQTQIFIETPYRNRRLLQNLLLHLHPETRLCIAVDITSRQENIVSKVVREWKQEAVELTKAPAIFMFLA